MCLGCVTRVATRSPYCTLTIKDWNNNQTNVDPLVTINPPSNETSWTLCHVFSKIFCKEKKIWIYQGFNNSVIKRTRTPWGFLVTYTLCTNIIYFMFSFFCHCSREKCLTVGNSGSLAQHWGNYLVLIENHGTADLKKSLKMITVLFLFVEQNIQKAV